MKLPYRSLPALLEEKAEARPEKVGFLFEDQPLTYQWLARQSRKCAAHLYAKGFRPGSVLLLVVGNSPLFLTAFFGGLYGGGTVAPIFPNSDPERCLQYLRLSGAHHLIVAESYPYLEDLKQKLATEQLILIVENEWATAEEHAQCPESLPDHPALIQYTSGSTGNPKGVLLTHRAILTNIQQMVVGMQITTQDRFVSWLPLFHDMGLLLMALTPLYLGIPAVLLSESYRLLPHWLNALETHRATFTAAPDFAWRLAIRLKKSGKKYELSSLRLALNAAEPVRPTTIQDFEKAFGLQHVIVAGYGLAEATVGVASWEPGRPPLIDAAGHVSVGKGFPEVQVKIWIEGKFAPMGKIGEILIQSPANTIGYLHNPKANEDLFRNETWIHTGDLGYLDEQGNLFIVGRIKNMIKQGGRTFYAEDVEGIVESLDKIRLAAAAGMLSELTGEDLYVFAETVWHRPPTSAQMEDCYNRIVQALHRQLGQRPARVYLLRAKSIPKTLNGKKQHKKLVQNFTHVQKWRESCILYPV